MHSNKYVFWSYLSLIMNFPKKKRMRFKTLKKDLEHLTSHIVLSPHPLFNYIIVFYMLNRKKGKGTNSFVTFFQMTTNFSTIFFQTGSYSYDDKQMTFTTSSYGYLQKKKNTLALQYDTGQMAALWSPLSYVRLYSANKYQEILTIFRVSVQFILQLFFLFSPGIIQIATRRMEGIFVLENKYELCL